MSSFFCRNLIEALHNVTANQSVVVQDNEGAVYTPPTAEQLVSAVDQVCGAGWFRARARQMGVLGQLDDIRQVTAMNVWRARETFDPAFPVIARVTTIARHALIDAVRSQSRRRAIELFDIEGEQRIDPEARGPGVVGEVLENETRQRLAALIASAPPLIQQILHLLDSGMTFEEVAATLGKKKPAVVSMHHRWRIAAREILEGE